MWRYFVLILASVFLFSCATRKVAVSKIKEETKIDSVVTEKKDSTAIQQNAVSIKEDIHEIEVTPIDTTKPMIIGDKQYVNAVVKIKKTKRAIVDSSKTVVVKAEEKKAEVKKEEQKKSFVKSVDKKPSYMFLWWLLLIPVGVWLVRRYLLK